MASSAATTVEEYLAEMPEDRRAAIEAVLGGGGAAPMAAPERY